MPRQDSGTTTGGDNLSAREDLNDLINSWERTRSQIEELNDWLDQFSNDPEVKQGGSLYNTFQRKQKALENAKNARSNQISGIVRIVTAHPQLYDVAVNKGFNENVLQRAGLESQGGGGSGGSDTASGGNATDDTQAAGGGSDNNDSGGGTGGKGGGGGSKNLKKQAQDNRLLDGGTTIRLPSGMYVQMYEYRIDGQVTRVGVKLGTDADKVRSRYGLNTADAKSFTAAQAKRIKNIGWADELTPAMRKGDKHVLKSLTRYLRNQYGGQPILEDDEVMGVVIANSMFGWTQGEFENRLRQTGWYKNTNDYQREWATTISPKQKKDTIGQTLERVVNTLEDHYGLDWSKHVKGGMGTAREAANKIASGVWGTPDAGFGYWAENQFDRAAKIEGTNAWRSRQKEEEERRRELNRPEDMAEKLRSEAINYLGQINGKPLLDNQTLKRWSVDLVTGERSDAEWTGFLRQQLKALHPYFDPNIAFQDQAAPYRSVYESVMGSPVSWDDPLLRQFHALDKDGNAVRDQPMSLHDFELAARDPDKNPDAWKEGTGLYEEGLSALSGLLNTMRGVR
jgi:hypothetical protein